MSGTTQNELWQSHGVPWAIPLQKIVHPMGDDKWCPGGGGGGGGGCWKYDVVEGGV